MALRENGRQFEHFHHERARAGAQIVVRADTSEDAVDNPDRGSGGGHEAADLGHEDDQGDLAQVGGLAGHVGAGEHGDLTLGGVKERVVGHETLVLAEFDDGMTSGLDFQAVTVVQLGPHVALAFGHLGQAGGHVERREGLSSALE